MAKKFNTIYEESKEKVYSNSAYALLLATAQIPGVRFKPTLESNGKTDGTTPEYAVQRRKRPRVNTVANPNAGTTASALAALDQLPKTEWETVEVATGVMKSVGFNETINDDFDFSNSPQHSRDLEYQVGEIAISRHKALIDLLKTASPTGAALPAYTANDTKVWDAISDEVIKLAAIDDSFKASQNVSDFYIVMSNTVAKELTKEMGIAFQNEAAIAQTGFKTNMSINGTPVIVDATLTGREVFIYHQHSIAKNDVEPKPINVDLSVVKFTGAFWYDIMSIIDSARIVRFGTTKK